MAIVRFNPFRDIDIMQRQMNRLFDEMISYGDAGNAASGFEKSAGMSFIPAAEIHETPEEVTLRMEVPGIEPKDLDVKVTADAVAIQGERKSEVKQDNQGIQRSEFRYGSFQRVIPLPARVQNDKVQAEFKHGVLHLTLPKAEEEKNRVVTVNLLNGHAQANGQMNEQNAPLEMAQGQESQAPQAT
ncbi:MAG: Hsp20/alpha crystallin family protein [Myxacorys californica WJT36-NPBG1]|jgi:HSP20 family protein|nr:Hsp20/alpha crystallin family protein [Myxacorys californica WJT36-NPBG1]